MLPVVVLVSPMYSKEIYKQLELIKEVLALSALMANKDFPSKKIQQRLKEIAFPEELEFEEDYYKVPKWARTDRCKELFRKEKNDL